MAAAVATGPQLSVLTDWMGDFLAAGGKDISTEIYNYLAPVNLPRLKSRLARLLRVRAVKVKGKKQTGRKSKLVGFLYERLIQTAVEDCKQVVRHFQNIRSTIAEIDFVLQIEPAGLLIPMLRMAGTHLMVEAKFYLTGPKTQWVTELCGLLPAHGCKLAILFVGCKPKTLDREFRTAIALEARGGLVVVPFGLAQWERVVNGENFLQVLAQQHTAAQVHTTKLAV